MGVKPGHQFNIMTCGRGEHPTFTPSVLLVDRLCSSATSFKLYVHCQNKKRLKDRMLTRYIRAAMDQATYELMEDGSFYGEISACRGVWSNADALEACQEALQESLEEWIALSLRLGHPLPVIGGIDVNPHTHPN